MRGFIKLEVRVGVREDTKAQYVQVKHISRFMSEEERTIIETTTGNLVVEHPIEQIFEKIENSTDDTQFFQLT